GEVRRQRQSTPVPPPLVVVFGGQLPDQLVRAGVLPHDRVAERLTGGGVPQQGGLPLVGDADRGQVGAGQAGAVQCPADHPLGLVPDLGRVVLHPSGLGKDLPVFGLVSGDDGAVGSEQDAAGGGGPLIN